MTRLHPGLEAMWAEYLRFVRGTRVAMLPRSELVEHGNAPVTMPPRIRPEEARLRVRLEVAFSALDELLMNVNDVLGSESIYAMIDRTDGPMTYRGMAIYEVRKLPEPGWRVISA